jgi:hypothetical protein
LQNGEDGEALTKWLDQEGAEELVPSNASRPPPTSGGKTDDTECKLPKARQTMLIIASLHAKVQDIESRLVEHSMKESGALKAGGHTPVAGSGSDGTCMEDEADSAGRASEEGPVADGGQAPDTIRGGRHDYASSVLVLNKDASCPPQYVERLIAVLAEDLQGADKSSIRHEWRLTGRHTGKPGLFITFGSTAVREAVVNRLRKNLSVTNALLGDKKIPVTLVTA